MPTFTSFTKVLGLANKSIKLFLRKRLSRLERQIGEEFDRDHSLKIDRALVALEENSNNHKQENGFLAGVIKAVTKKATTAALRWFQPETILRAASWKKRIANLLGNGRY